MKDSIVHCCHIQPLSVGSWRAHCISRSPLKEKEVSGPLSLSPSSAAKCQFLLLASASPVGRDDPQSVWGLHDPTRALQRPRKLSRSNLQAALPAPGLRPRLAEGPGLPPEWGTGCMPSRGSCHVSVSAHPWGLVVTLAITSLPGLPEADGSSWQWGWVNRPLARRQTVYCKGLDLYP